MVFPDELVQAAETPPGADGRTCAWAWALLPVARASVHAVADAIPAPASNEDTRTTVPTPARCLKLRTLRSEPDQLVQPSVAGLVVTVAAPPDAVMPVNEGIEKKVLAQARGAAAVMLASLVSVTVNGLLA